jgi:hypothetical protein
MLTTALVQRKYDGFPNPLVNGLLTILARLERAQAAFIRGQAALILANALVRETDPNARLALESELATVSARLEPAMAARVWGEVAQNLSIALARQTDAGALHNLASDLGSVSVQLDAPAAARICGQAARTLAVALEREEDVKAWRWLAVGLESVASRTEPAQAASICGQVARRLIPSMERIRSTDVFGAYYSPGTEWVSFVSSRMDPAEAARINGQAARLLATAPEHEKDVTGRNTLASGLASLAGRLDPAEAPRISSHAARSLGDALARETNEEVRVTISSGLSSVAARMAAAEAARVAAAALRKTTNPPCLTLLARILSAALDRLDDAEADRACDQLIESLNPDSFSTIAPELLQQLNPERVHALAWHLPSRMCSTLVRDTDAFSRILTDASREQRARRAARMAFAGQGLEVALVAAVRILAEPFPCRLTTQELVELLKMPTCFGAARRIVLDHLGNRYRRHFVNHWAFVRFATEQELCLDFTTPPKRLVARSAGHENRHRRLHARIEHVCTAADRSGPVREWEPERW